MGYKMRTMLCVGILCAGLPMARGDVWDFYDGWVEKSGGVTCAYYNRGGYMAWKHLGGDWVDAQGQAQGDTPFSTVHITRSQEGMVEVDVTAAVSSGNDGLVLRKDRGTVNFHSSETALGPQLFVTQADGSMVTLRPQGDTSTALMGDGQGTNCSSLGALGESPMLNLGHAILLSFPALPVGYRAVALQLHIAGAAYNDTTVQVYALRKPSAPQAPITTGFASKYPRDRGICTDPRVLYCEDWDTDPHNWWKRTGTVPTCFRCTRVTNGVALFDRWGRTFYAPGEGFIGAGLRVEISPDTLGQATPVPTADFVKLGFGEQEHLFYRYYLKHSPEFRDSTECQGGKHPGLSGDTTVGGGQGRVNGTQGWSLRGGYLLNCDKNNPVYPRVVLTTYAYHGDMKGFFGDHWPWVGRGDTGFSVLGQWNCIEGEVRVNTPGVHDGVLRTWVNGRLAFEKTDLYLRALPPYKVAGNLGIQKFWGTLHHGGRIPFGHTARVWMDQTVVATSRIGCVAQ